MPTMKRIQYHRYGGPEVLRLEETDVPAPGRGELLVRVRAASANPADFHVRNGGLRLVTGRRFPRGFGHDFAGVVEQVGANVTRFRPGDEVFGGLGMRSPGGFGEYVVAEENRTTLKPAGLSFEAAGSIATAGATGINAVTRAYDVQPGRHVFITGCLGAVGRTAAQFALLRGARVAGSCRESARADAEALGIDPVVGFDFDPAPFAGRFDLVYDTAGVLPIKVARSLLKPGGLVVDPVLSPAKLLRAPFVRQYKPETVPWDHTTLAEIGDAAASGSVDIAVARTVPLADAVAALTELELRGTPKGGKLVVVP